MHRSARRSAVWACSRRESEWITVDYGRSDIDWGGGYGRGDIDWWRGTVDYGREISIGGGVR